MNRQLNFLDKSKFLAHFIQIFSDYLISKYPDINEDTSFEHYFDYTNFKETSQDNEKSSSSNLKNLKLITGYGTPHCKTGEKINIWINKHNESYFDENTKEVEKLHYHSFVITKLLNSTVKDMVKLRLFDFDLNFHIIEYKMSWEYCLDTAFRVDNVKGS